MNELAAGAIEKFKSHKAVIGLIGLGYAGLPLCCCFAEAGFETIGFDLDPIKIKALEAGQSYIEHIPAARIQSVVSSGALKATTSFDQLARCDVAIICVPTPLGEGKSPDLRHIVDTTREIKQRLHRGQLVVLESTTYPGTTDELVRGILDETGLQPGRDYFLAFSPEREDPANHAFHTGTIPKLVGGVTKDCLAVAAAAYGEAVKKVVRVSSARVAEASKLLENIYRCVNVAMVNELKVLFQKMDIDIWEVIEAASTKPFGFTPFYPGPGLGGHCIPIDPVYLTWKARQYDFPTRFIELAGEINGVMPTYVVDRLVQGLNLHGKPLKDSRILLLGVAYKADVDDVRESPSLRIIRILEERLANVSFHDPHVPILRSRYLTREMKSVPLTVEIVREADAAVVLTSHRKVDYEMLVKNAKLLVDTRNVTAPWKDSDAPILQA
jgi:UDP-N-acetyl-D-glucosamine dehydrogenase